MTPDQYTDLIGFLGRKFDGMESRLDGHDRQFDEIRRHATVLFEQAREERRAMMEGIDARFEQVDARFEQVDARFEGVDSRLDGIDHRLDGIDGRLFGIDRRLDRIDGRPLGDSSSWSPT